MARPCIPWTMREKQLVTQKYATHTARELGELVGHPATSVVSFLHNYGIRKPGRKPYPTPSKRHE